MQQQLKIIQVNLNRSRLAQELLEQEIAREGYNLAIVSEYNRKKPAWRCDGHGGAALWVSKRIGPSGSGPSGRNYTSVRINNILVISCYLPPNDTLQEYRESLTEIAGRIQAHRGECMIAGDFNAKSPLWGCTWTDKRGELLASTLIALKMYPTNQDSTPTFWRAGKSSKIDFLATTEGLVEKGIKSTTQLKYNASDHRYLIHEIGDAEEINDTHRARWDGNKLDQDKLQTIIQASEGIIEELDHLQHEERIEGWTHLMLTMCDRTMPIRTLKEKRKKQENAYWWNHELSTLRGLANKSRRRLHKEYRRRQPNEIRIQALQRECQENRRILKNKIRRAKGKAWDAFCKTLNEDAWGKPYKTVMKAIKKKEGPVTLPKEETIETIKKLFRTEPTGTPPALGEISRETRRRDICPPVTEDEVLKAMNKISAKKAPGIDQMPIGVIREIFKKYPRSITAMYQSCLESRTFPEVWKVQKLILLPKGKQDTEGRQQYRPISLIPNNAKIYEHILKQRLEEEIRKKGDYAQHQYGFRRGRSTVDALMEVQRFAKEAKDGNKSAIMVTIDVKNAFNTLRWTDIENALIQKGISKYLVKTISNYLSNRKIVAEGEEIISCPVYAGVPQGSVLGPTLWNITFDEIVAKYNTGKVKCIAYADDLAVLVSAVSHQVIAKRADKTYCEIKQWINKKDMEIAETKTEIMQIAGLRRHKIDNITLDNKIITVSKTIKYLGVTLDAAGTYRAHVGDACKRSNGITAALSSILKNTGGVKNKARKLIMSVPKSVLLYAAPVFAHVCRHEWAKKEMRAVQRNAAIRTAMAYSTVSAKALDVLTGTIPIELEVARRKILYYNKEGKKITDRPEEKKLDPTCWAMYNKIPKNKEIKNSELHKIIMVMWQEEWDTAKQGRWTHEWIPNIEKWINRRHGALTYHVTQALTGHGCFGTFVHKIGKEATPICWLCAKDPDDPEHTLFKCIGTKSIKMIHLPMEAQSMTPGKLLEWATQKGTNWLRFEKWARGIITIKEVVERQREKLKIRNEMSLDTDPAQ